jgi:hypothetical protein
MVRFAHALLSAADHSNVRHLRLRWEQCERVTTERLPPSGMLTDWLKLALPFGCINRTVTSRHHIHYCGVTTPSKLTRTIASATCVRNISCGQT